MCKVNQSGLNVCFLQSSSVTRMKALPSGVLWAAASLPEHREQQLRQGVTAGNSLPACFHQPSQHVLASWVEAYYRTFPELPGIKARNAVNPSTIPLYPSHTFCLSPQHNSLWGLDGCSCSAPAMPVQPLCPPLSTDLETAPPPSPSTQLHHHLALLLI